MAWSGPKTAIYMDDLRIRCRQWRHSVRLGTNGAFIELHSFNGPEGLGPGAMIQGWDGNLYGVTSGAEPFGHAPCFACPPTARCAPFIPLGRRLLRRHGRRLAREPAASERRVSLRNYIGRGVIYPLLRDRISDKYQRHTKHAILVQRERRRRSHSSLLQGGDAFLYGTTRE